jgi:hypothetical protein
VVAAADPDAVRARLRPQLGDRLCVVASRWTTTELGAVRGHLHARRRAWNLLRLGQSAGEDGQACIGASLTRMLPEPTDEDWAQRAEYLDEGGSLVASVGGLPVERDGRALLLGSGEHPRRLLHRADRRPAIGGPRLAVAQNSDLAYNYDHEDDELGSGQDAVFRPGGRSGSDS